MDKSLAESKQNTDTHNISEWIEKNVGGKVVSIQQLRRWRPIWRVELVHENKNKALLVKGVRAWACIDYSLMHEMQCMQVLEKNGIPVPHVYGMINTPEAFVMDWIDADERDPGLIAQAIEEKSYINSDRWAASLEYMEVLVRMHNIPVREFIKTEAGNPVGSENIALAHYNRYIKMLEDRDAMDAIMEFFTRWIRKNAPRHRDRPAFLTGDCGQFLNTGKKLTTVLDVEIGHIGDPMYDLACFRGRHPVENMGDVPALFRHYQAASGEKIDLTVLAYHTVVFLAQAIIGPMIAMHEKHSGGDWVEGYLQVIFIARRALEGMGEILNIDLDAAVADIELPEAHIAPVEKMAFDKLLSEIETLPLSNEFAQWQRDVLASLPQFLISQVNYGRWLEQEDLKDVGNLVGKHPANIVEADQVLKEFVQNAEPENDDALVKLFYRRMRRQCLAFAGPHAPPDHLLFIKLEPILNEKI
jgi:aminoglycoside phosphotransferase (APT) family kinase protein